MHLLGSIVSPHPPPPPPPPHLKPGALIKELDNPFRGVLIKSESYVFTQLKRGMACKPPWDTMETSHNVN